MRKIFTLGILLLASTTVIVILIGRSNAFEDGKIVFTGEGNPMPDIYSIDIDGKNLKNLTNHPAIDYMPAPSPNGRYIAFISWRKGESALFIMDTDGNNPKLLIEGVSERVTWSPDGKWVAFRGGIPDIVAVNIKSGERKVILDINNNDWRQIRGILTPSAKPTWSPDGKKIAFRVLGAHGEDNNSDIYTIDVDGANIKRLTNHPVRDNEPAWSPDSKHIAFQSVRDNGGIFVVDSDGAPESNIKQIYKSQSACCPSWSQNGLIAFYSEGGIHVMKSDGSDVRQVFKDGGEPSWLEQRFFRVESGSKWTTTWGKIKSNHEIRKQRERHEKRQN